MQRVIARRMSVIVAILAAASFAAATSAAVFQQYVGAMSTNTGDVTAGGIWGHGATITWEVDNNSVGLSTWHYNYTFSVVSNGSDAISYLNLETPNFTFGDLLALKWGGPLSIGNMSTASNPSMPSNIYGMKYSNDGNGYFNWSFGFDTAMGPTWGDFYAKGGGTGNYAFNKGFKSPLTDPTLADWPLQNGPAESCLLVPGTPGNVGRSGALKVVTFRDNDKAGTAKTDPNFALTNWWIDANSASGSVPSQLSGTDGSALFAPLNGQFPWVVGEANMPAGWQFTAAYLYNDANGAFLGKVTDPTKIFADISANDVDVYIGNVLVPEPATVALLAAGGALLIARFRRRRQRA
jgi:hypothetical protein